MSSAVCFEMTGTYLQEINIRANGLRKIANALMHFVDWWWKWILYQTSLLAQFFQALLDLSCYVTTHRRMLHSLMQCRSWCRSQPEACGYAQQYSRFVHRATVLPGTAELSLIHTALDCPSVATKNQHYYIIKGPFLPVFYRPSPLGTNKTGNVRIT